MVSCLCAYDSVAYDQVTTRLLESQAEEEELNQSQSFQLRQSGFHQIVNISRVRRKWKRSDSSDSDSITLMTPLMTPIFDFHKVISVPTTLLMTPTLSPLLVKTSL